ncbi:UDPGP type 1 family protein [Tissierella sp. MB52-C2]|uniref:UDPGP type 1 family protein n=1 Tax=Tissierella sp. MB52-C2 TaxID=3070999 RepID=UPI00280BE54A|nr:UDPGP type 1 family protein [Tissierella sp. MB52-C2]WMM23931.1 UDPGP type 1 family protein [Tissierella sp. MB52-C2]
MKEKIQEVENILCKYGQEHLLRYFKELLDEEKENLLDQILSIDFDLIASLYKKAINHEMNENQQDLQPLKADEWDAIANQEKEQLYDIGIKKIKDGKTAVILLAGGQGTRLGYSGPKGTFDIYLPSHKSLFQLQCERLINISRKCGTYINWYIMTSHVNHDETVQFFDDNNYFNYPKENITFFKQGMLPAIDSNGKIFLQERGKVSMSPNGNGGCFLALKDKGILTEMKKRGIEWIFINGIDNALVRVADPYFLGFAVKTGLPSASKVVPKKSPDEKAGILCYRNGRPAIVEYSELPVKLAQKSDGDGNLIYDNANIINHLLKLEVIEEFFNYEVPFHVAHKKIPYLDINGNIEYPKEPNGYKFESFIFDIFSYVFDMAVLKVRREEEFAPVKNKDGEDSPFTAKNLVLDLQKNWLINSGINSKLLHGKTVEISPLSSYNGENIDKELIRDKLLRADTILI